MADDPTRRELELKIADLENRLLDREKALANLRESIERYRFFFENAPDFVYISDLYGYIIDINITVERVCRRPKKELIGKNFKDIAPAEVYEIISEAVRKIIQTGEPLRDFPLKLALDAGHFAYYEIDITPLVTGGRITGFQGSARDITARKASEERLRQSEEKYRTILDSVDEGYFEVDLAGNLTYSSAWLHNETDRRPDDLQGLHYSQYMTPESRARIFQAFNRTFLTGKPAIKVDADIITISGKPRTVEISASLMKDETGRTIGFRGVTRDITEHKAREEELRKSEERYRTILESVEEGYFEVDLGGRFTFFNDWLSKVSKIPPEKLLGMKYSDYMTPESAEKIFRVFNRIFETGEPATKIDYEIILGDNSRGVHELSASLIKDHQGRPAGFRGVARDVTERKKTEEALRESEEKYRTILENIEDAYFETDLAGYFTFFNDSVCRILGYSRDELMGMNNRIYMDKTTARQAYLVFNQIFRTGIPHKGFNYEIIRKDGLGRHIETSISLIRDKENNPAGFRGIARDITERQRTEQDLKESEGKYRTILECIEEAYFELDFNGRFTFFNDFLTGILGCPRDELLTLNYRAFMTEETAGVLQKFFDRIRETGETQSIEAYEIIRKDGRRAFHAMTASLRRDKNGLGLGFRGLTRDITELKLAGEENKKLEARLIQSQKMEAIGTLAGGIAHNFNNLLMGIQGNASIMLLDSPPEHPHYHYLRNIEKQVQSGAKLTRQLLGYAREGRYEIKPLDLNQLLKDTSDTFATTRKDITVHRNLADDLCDVVAEQGQIEQVLLNLYINAAEAMPGGGELFLKTENVTHQDIKSKAYIPEPGQYVLLSVRDTGIGMDEKTKARIFTPFFTTKGLARGTGLGLASTYGIIKGHGGYIEVESEPDRGATFKIYLPASPEAAVSGPESPAPDTILTGTETVLLVDDEELILETGRQMLEIMGYTVLQAANGKEALRLYRQNREIIDIVLLDMVMPDMSGGETFDGLKQINPEVKVLLSSGYSLDGQAAEILDRGCNAFIQKPFSLEQLSASLRKVLA